MNVRSKAIQRALGASDGVQQSKPGMHHDFRNLEPSAKKRFPGRMSEAQVMKEGPVSYLGRRHKLGGPKVHSGMKGRDILAAPTKGS